MEPSQCTVERVDRVPVEVPFRPVPARNMARELPHWRYFEVVEVELSSGHVGHGETMLFYSWGETDDDDIDRAIGTEAADLLWDDSVGPGLQIALFDALGRALGVPAHALFGEQVRENVPVSWWCIDMPAEDWVAEARKAVDSGYTDLKVKGRPWFDLRSQVESLDEELPDWFAVDIDFNETLLDADRALDLLGELAAFDCVSHVEEPIPVDDTAGNRRLNRSLPVETVLHFGRRGDPIATLCADICDGFVVPGGAAELANSAAVCATADTPFWLQLVGTGITAAFSLQCGAAFEQATWPAINCHQIYEHDLLADSITVEDGLASVPESHGLGFEVDMDAVERYRTEKPDSQPYPHRIIEVDWADGPTMYYSGNDDQLLAAARAGEIPYFERGVSLRMIPDDGTDEWQSLAERVATEPLRTETKRF